jgi:hypothetical protein
MSTYSDFQTPDATPPPEKVCMEEKKHIKSLEACYMEVQSSYFIPYQFIEAFFTNNAKDVKISALKDFHNQKCSDFTKTLFNVK